MVSSRLFVVRFLLIGLVLLLAGFAAVLALAPGVVERGYNQVLDHQPYSISRETRAFHDRLALVDLHADSLLWKRNLLARGGRGHVDIPRLLEGGFALQVFSAVTKTPAGQNYSANSGDSDQLTLLTMAQAWPPRTWRSLYQRALFQAEKLEHFADRSGGSLRIIRTQENLQDLRAARAAGDNIVGGLLAIEGAHALEGRLDAIDRLWEAGYRMIGPTHFFDNELGGSLHGTGKGGLSDFGRQAVARMAERGIIIDLAHASQAMVRDVLAMGVQGLVVSHTGLRGICDSPRNISDDLMRQIAQADGLIGIGYWGGAVCDVTPAGIAKSIAYGVELLGADHVALGSDYDGAVTVSFDSSEIAILTEELLTIGLDQETIAKVMGENALAFLARHLPRE